MRSSFARTVAVAAACAAGLSASLTVSPAGAADPGQPERAAVTRFGYKASDELEFFDKDGKPIKIGQAAKHDADALAPSAPQAAREEAQRGLDWRAEHNRGGTMVGVARARDLANGRALSPDTIRRMVSYFARHEIDKQGEGYQPGEPGYPSAGRIAWALWGGDAGREWAERMAAEIDDQE
ncbi:MAG: hypothetical protein WCS84_10035 [Nocardioides sp.]